MANIANLVALVRHHRRLYYNEQPEISDAQFDALVDQIRHVDPSHPVLGETGAPPADDSPWEKVEHEILTGSQSKVTCLDEFNRWLQGVQEAAKSIIKQSIRMFSLAIDPKLDGVDLSLRYENGILVHAITRGDGTVGEDILRNALNMRGVPSRISQTEPVTVRGQMMIDKATFSTIAGQYKNARNACAGISRRLDGQQSNLISFIAFDCFGAGFGGEEILTEMGRHAWLIMTGFKAVKRICVIGIDALCEAVEDWERRRPGYELEMDGLVIRVDDLKLQEAMGHKQQCPVGQVAWKFDSETGTTKVVDILWQPTRGSDSGRITPKAVLEPVDVLGVTITNATLNNPEFMTALGVSIGATVTVARANDVIPQITLVLEPGTGSVKMPTTCPTCSHGLVLLHKDLICPNATCPDKTLARIQRWVTVTDMLGLGEKIVEALVLSRMVKTPADLYELKAEDIAGLERMGDKSAAKVVEAIQSRRSLTLGRFVDALGIADVGESTLQPVIRAGFNTLAKLRAAKQSDLLQVKGIGEDTADRIVRGLGWYSPTIDALLEVGIEVIEPREEGKLLSLSFCFTGAVQSCNAAGKRYTRKELQEMVVREGGSVKDSVGSGLTFLVQADPTSTSSKSVAAKKIGVRIISDAEFLNMIERHDT